MACYDQKKETDRGWLDSQAWITKFRHSFHRLKPFGYNIIRAWLTKQIVNIFRRWVENIDVACWYRSGWRKFVQRRLYQCIYDHRLVTEVHARHHSCLFHQSISWLVTYSLKDKRMYLNWEVGFTIHLGTVGHYYKEKRNIKWCVYR